MTIQQYKEKRLKQAEFEAILLLHGRLVIRDGKDVPEEEREKIAIDKFKDFLSQTIDECVEEMKEEILSLDLFANKYEVKYQAGLTLAYDAVRHAFKKDFGLVEAHMDKPKTLTHPEGRKDGE